MWSGLTSRWICRLALQLHAAEILAHWVNQGFPYLMRTLLYLSEGWHNYGRRITLVSSKLTLEMTLQFLLADQTTSRITAELGNNWGAPWEEVAISCYCQDVKKEWGKFLHIHRNSKLVLHSYHKLIGYWRLKWNATSSILFQVTVITLSF